MMAGYSGTPLPRKLGIEADMSIGLLDAPDSLGDALGELPDPVNLHHELKPSDMFLVFATSQSDMKSWFEQAMRLIPPEGAIWVAWPKKSSGIATDLSENTMRDLFLSTGMVDNKVCAIDDIWSGLRFVVRKENRGTWGEA